LQDAERKYEEAWEAAQKPAHAMGDQGQQQQTGGGSRVFDVESMKAAGAHRAQQGGQQLKEGVQEAKKEGAQQVIVGLAREHFLGPADVETNGRSNSEMSKLAENTVM
jgi:uncharacterized membrane protein YcjF (UPF0283 family)